MSRRRRQSSIEIMVEFALLVISSVVGLLIRVLSFLFDLISFSISGYKSKSGNGFFKTYFDKGAYGEFVLYRKISKLLGKQTVFTNLYLENKNTETTEIDVLAVSSKGIYVFEMKNFSGYIYGSEKDVHWTQVLNRRTKNSFYNPLKQNYAHVKAVQNYLGLSNEKIIPVVVFSNKCSLKKLTLSDGQHVFQYGNAIRFVKKMEKKGTSAISSQEIEEFTVRLIQKCNMPEEVKQKHIDDVVALKKGKEYHRN